MHISASIPKPVPPRYPLARVAPAHVSGVTDVIWSLSSILTDPASTPAAAGTAKRRMLRVLDERKGCLLPHMIVPPITFNRSQRYDETNE